MTKIKIEDYKGKNITYTLNPEDEISILTTTEDDELGEEFKITNVNIDINSLKGIKEVRESLPDITWEELEEKLNGI